MSSDPANVLRGHKAALSNPKVSDEAKKRSAGEVERLQEEIGSGGDDNATYSPDGGDDEVYESTGSEADTKHRNQQLGGYKAVLHNDSMTQETKDNAAEKLKQAGESF